MQGRANLGGNDFDSGAGRRPDGLIAMRSVDVGQPGDKRQVRACVPGTEDMLDGVAGFAARVVDAMQPTKASKVSLRFGCDFATESGSFVAVMCKTSAKSTMKVSLEWVAPTT